MTRILRYAAALVAAAVLCGLPIGAWAQSSGGSEVGSFPNAAPLNGSERILADQNASTVNLTPVQIGQYLGIPTGWSFPLPITFGGTGANTATAALLNLLPALVSGGCLSNNGTAILWASCGSGGSPGGSSYSIQYNDAGSFGGLLPGSTGYYCLYWSSLTGAPALSSSSSCPGGTGSMTWPAAAGIPNYSGSSSWGTSYSASNTIPADYIPTLNQSTTGNAATATALAANPTLCSSGEAAQGILASGNATGCFTPTGSGTVNSATEGDIACYLATGTAVSGCTLANGLAVNSGVLGIAYNIDAQTGTSYTIASTDLGELVTFDNSSSVAVTVPQATGTFGAGTSFDVQNLGVGTATLTPTTSTINGAASLAVAQNQGCTITSDGTNWQVSACTAVVSSGGGGTPENVQVFTTSETWTKPSDNPSTVTVSCIGGGGGGASGSVEPSGTLAVGGSGGGGGAFAQMTFAASSLPSTVTVTIGAGGTGGTAVTSAGVGTAGTNGAASTFGSLLTAFGGGSATFVGANSDGGGGAGLLSGANTASAGSVCGSVGGGGNGPAPTCGQGGGAGAGSTGNSGGAGGSAFLGGSGGGAGGSLATTPVSLTGGASGAVGSHAAVGGGGAASNGNAGAQGTGAYASGTGGSGGGSNASGTGGSGGAGSIGGGGGGGGASETTSGAGGNGGSGECVAVTVY